MEQVTLLLGIIGSVLALVVRPAYALVVYIGVLVWYPQYLSIRVGTADFTAGRIVIIVLFLRCLLSSDLRRSFSWSRLDTYVSISIATYVTMYFLTRPFSVALENQSGAMLNTFCTYMAARMIIRDKDSLVRFVMGISVTLAALAIVGILESVTHRYYFLPLLQYRKWDTPTENPASIPPKWGLHRAVGPFSHAIMFGTCFAMFLPLVWSLRRERRWWTGLVYVAIGLCILGALSSLSSNAWMSTFFAIAILLMEKRRQWVKPLLKVLLVSVIFVQIASNRDFYYVLLQYANPASGGWWQRGKLIECAIDTFDEWWLLGYKGQDPGWGPRMGMGHTDVNNEFILAGVNYGVWGLIALCVVFVVSIRELVRSYRRTRDPTLRSWIWACGTVVVGFIITFQGVSLFGQNGSLFYCLLGLTGSVTGFSAAARTAVPSRGNTVVRRLGDPMAPVTADAR